MKRKSPCIHCSSMACQKNSVECLNEIMETKFAQLWEAMKKIIVQDTRWEDVNSDITQVRNAVNEVRERIYNLEDRFPSEINGGGSE